MENGKALSKKPGLLRSVYGIRVIFTKEAVDNLRDRRTILSGLITTLITPTLLIALIVVMGNTIFADAADTQVFLPVVGAENAPELINFLKQNGIQILPAPGDPLAEVRSGNYDVVLVIPQAYAEDFSHARPATLQLIRDSSRQSAIVSVQKVQQLLDQYHAIIGNLRLVARGVDPSLVSPLALENIDVATPRSQIMIFLGMMPFLIMITIFTGGVNVIIDTTAGERERSSLEPLLINPVPRWQFVVGKYLSALPFVAAVLAITLSAYAIGFNLVPIEQYIGRRISLDFPTILNIYLICLPIILFASAMQMVVATFTHSFKEAQTYVTLMSFIPALPGAFLAFLPSKADLWKMLIPTYGQQVLIEQVLRDEPVSMINILAATLATILGALILLAIAIRLYQREQLLFGKR